MDVVRWVSACAYLTIVVAYVFTIATTSGYDPPLIYGDSIRLATPVAFAPTPTPLAFAPLATPIHTSYYDIVHAACRQAGILYRGNENCVVQPSRMS